MGERSLSIYQSIYLSLSLSLFLASPQIDTSRSTLCNAVRLKLTLDHASALDTVAGRESSAICLCREEAAVSRRTFAALLALVVEPAVPDVSRDLIAWSSNCGDRCEEQQHREEDDT